MLTPPVADQLLKEAERFLTFASQDERLSSLTNNENIGGFVKVLRVFFYDAQKRAVIDEGTRGFSQATFFQPQPIQAPLYLLDDEIRELYRYTQGAIDYRSKSRELLGEPDSLSFVQSILLYFADFYCDKGAFSLAEPYFNQLIRMNAYGLERLYEGIKADEESECHSPSLFERLSNVSSLKQCFYGDLYKLQITFYRLGVHALEQGHHEEALRQFKLAACMIDDTNLALRALYFLFRYSINASAESKFTYIEKATLSHPNTYRVEGQAFQVIIDCAKGEKTHAQASLDEFLKTAYLECKGYELESADRFVIDAVSFVLHWAARHQMFEVSDDRRWLSMFYNRKDDRLLESVKAAPVPLPSKAKPVILDSDPPRALNHMRF